MPWSEKTNLATEASVKRKQVQHLVVFQTREFSSRVPISVSRQIHITTLRRNGRSYMIRRGAHGHSHHFWTNMAACRLCA